MKKLLLLVFLVFTTMIFAQKLKVVSGNFDFLKDQTEVNVELTFDSLLLMKENITEAEYLNKRKNDLLVNPKRGVKAWEKWNSEWEYYKTSVYPEKVLNALNNSRKIIFGRNVKTKYTLIVDGRWVNPGWQAGVITQPAILNTYIKFVETDNPSKVLMTLSSIEIQGKSTSGSKDFIMEYERISSAYERTGRLLLRELNKGTK